MRSSKAQDGTGPASLQIRLLGSPEISLHGAPVRGLRSVKAQALLFYLAVSATPHTRAALATLLWGDFPDSAARSNLRKALHYLRSHLEGYLAIERDSVGLSPDADCWVDVAEFDAALQDGTESSLQRATELYRGDFLEGFYIRDALDFEGWWLAERARLRERMLDSLYGLADRRARLGDLEGAIALTRRFLDLEPWREEAHRRLMGWLALNGQRSAALAQFEACRQVLEEELAVEPAAETIALYEQIRNGELEHAPGDRLGPPLAAPRAPAFLDRGRARDKGAEPPASLLPTGEPFVGRESELARLEAFLRSALRAETKIAFVRGEAGWGKTSLLSAFSYRAQAIHPDLIVSTGVCSTHTGRGDPYLPFREIVRNLSVDIETGWAAGTITHQHALRLWKFLPMVVKGLLRHGPDLIDTFVPGEALLQGAAAHDALDLVLLDRLRDRVLRGHSGGEGSGLDQERIFEEYTNLLRSLAQSQPLLLILDDLHWADASSVNLLFHLARRLTASPILILGAYRPEEVSLGRDGHEHPLVEFKRSFGDVWVNLGQDDENHDREAGRTFVDALLDLEPNRLGEEFRWQLAHNTKGHPLFTVEILRDMQARGHLFHDQDGFWIESPDITWDALPGRVEGVIEKRIHLLSAEVREALATASVQGEAFTAEVVARARRVDDQDMVRVFSGDLAKRYRLVRARGVRQVGNQRVSRYRFRHNLFQRYLYQGLDPAERAYTHEAVGNALETLCEGRTEEMAIHLARHFREAGVLYKAVKYLWQAGDSAARIYANAEAIALYDQAIQLALDSGASSQTLTLLYTRLGRALELDSQFDQGLETYSEMGKLARQRGDRSMELASLIGHIAIHSVPTVVHDPERARALAQQALALAAERDDPAAEARIHWSLALANYYSNRLPNAIQCGERSLALARELDLVEQRAQTLNDLGGQIYLYSGHIDQAREALQEASELWRELGNRPMLADSLSGSCIAHVYAGDYDRAIALSAEALEISQSIDNLWGQSYSLWSVGDAFRARGEYSRAIEVSEECTRLGKLAGFIAAQTYTPLRLALVYADLGAWDQARKLVQEALALSRTELPIQVVQALGVLAHIEIGQGRLTEAQRAIDEARGNPYQESWLVFVLPVLVAETELALRREEPARALAVTEDLIGRLREYGMRSLLPEALYLQGKALLGLGQEEAARERFLKARAEAESLGARRLLWRILADLGRLESDPARAQELEREARQVIETIASQIDRQDLQKSFLALAHNWVEAG
ncbi:MAG: AAA family ATPase [Anaerolineae bacterium]